MENRYKSCNIVTGSRKLESNGNQTTVSRLSTTFYPNLDTGGDNMILSQPGDRLDLIAKEYYGDETFWFVIAVSNNLGRGTLYVPPGTLLRIPRYSEYSGIASLVQSFNEER
jgi:nucleoid-associated protein YgaU